MSSHTRTVSVTTSWAALPDIPAGEVSILNNTGAALLVRMAGETVADENISLSDGQSAALTVTESAKEIEISAAAGTTGVQLIIS